MASSRAYVILVVAAAAMVAVLMAASAAEAQGVSCGSVNSFLAPCFAYLTKPGTPKPVSTSSCCSGVQRLNGAASSQPARQAICRCLESSAKNFKPIPAAVSSLPTTCGVPFPYSFDPNQDCSRIP